MVLQKMLFIPPGCSPQRVLLTSAGDIIFDANSTGMNFTNVYFSITLSKIFIIFCFRFQMHFSCWNKTGIINFYIYSILTHKHNEKYLL